MGGERDFPEKEVPCAPNSRGPAPVASEAAEAAERGRSAVKEEEEMFVVERMVLICTPHPLLPLVRAVALPHALVP